MPLFFETIRTFYTDVPDAIGSTYIFKRMMFKKVMWAVILLFYVTIYGIVFYCDSVQYPTPLTIADVDKSVSVPKSRLFSEERAWLYLEGLTLLGPKPTGSYANEVLAANLLKTALKDIQNGTNPVNEMELDVQLATGCFSLNFKDGMSSCYENVQNIVAKIGPKGNAANSSLLVNCHFDSVPTSPGASDDAANCAIMLEVLQALSKSEEPLQQNVIFLFNGAEENFLQASHGFISQHKWAKEIVGFINLEACGSGGKQMLFQADKEQTWLIEAYIKSATYPQGSVVAQDIFESGIIPSDTDYRIFVEFAGLPGLDFAFIKNGYVYHTKYDMNYFINPGAIQHAGDNLLNLIYECLKSPAMSDETKRHSDEAPLIFFDFLGFFMVSYSEYNGYCLSMTLILISMIDMIWAIFSAAKGGTSYFDVVKSIIKAFLTLVLSLVAALTANIIVALILTSVGCTMTWYQQPFWIVHLYVLPSLSAFMFVLGVTRRNYQIGQELFLDEVALYEAEKLIWIIADISLVKFSSRFICDAFLFVPLLARVFISIIMDQEKLKRNMHVYFCVHMVCQVIPLLLLFYCLNSLFSVFIPVLGRFGASVNPEIIMALLITIFVFISAVYMANIVHFTDKLKLIAGYLFCVTPVAMLLVSSTNYGFQYSENVYSPKPMRTYILHTERMFRNENGLTIANDSGYWVIPLDFNGPQMLRPYMNDLENVAPIDCDKHLMCGMPFYMSVASLLRKSYYLPAPKTGFKLERSLQMTKKSMKSNVHKLSFKVTGPDHMTLVLSPHQGYNLTTWSLYSAPPYPGLKWKDRETYFIFYSYGTSKYPWKFDIFLTELNATKGPLVDVLFVTHHIHGDQLASNELRYLVDSLPEWVHTTFWTATVDMYTF